MAYAPRSENSQRPLPNFRPPQYPQHQRSVSLHAPTPPSLPVAGADLSRSQSYHPNGRPGDFPEPPPPQLPGVFAGGFMPPSGPPPMQMPSPNVQFTRGMPPPGAMWVQPGDSRIGGRICWRCDGKGTISFMIFDSETCGVCRGVGRTFN